MAEPQQSDAAKKAAARRAKILARGNSGLNKLAQTARGDEAQSLYGNDFKPVSQPTPPQAEPVQPSWAPPPAEPKAPRPTASASPQPQMSSEQEAMARQMEAMMSMFGAPGNGAAGGEMPDMSKLLSQMMGDPSLAGGPAGQNLLGDMDDPAGLGAFGGAGGVPPNIFGGADGSSPFPFPGMQQQSQGKSKVARYFPLVHLVATLFLALFAVLWWEPALRSASAYQEEATTWSERWSGFSGRRVKGLGEVEVLVSDSLYTRDRRQLNAQPLFLAFVTVELILQSSRLMIFRSPPAPHALLQNFLPVLPQGIARPLLTGSRYLNLLNQTYKDGCLLVFAVGMTIVGAEWLRGSLIV
ncbi:hypothetical protein, variant 1 [Cryptococcus amylolentus CBS 6039]|uniref:Golgi to ER traffic protein 2 n=1 Tax=Cryptococcus amylolentus CBS 6039 TaxID=1295533 RepID=A0A1E3HFX0_9TREE|nr:hypothetical protein, variant 1 [Cryptococcus amylolentus CBS 6039]ODN75259.1 hypothetical protein, variant 1 [Cryptococcus amylolentus CBS 6039]